MALETTIRAKRIVALALGSALILCSRFACLAFAAPADSSLLKAKQTAEAKGYVFYSTRDEILSKAKKEANVHGLIGLVDALKPVTEAFRKKYPFINVDVQTLRTVDESQRALLNVKAGQAKWGRGPANTHSLQRLAAASLESRSLGHGRAGSARHPSANG